MYSIFNAMNTLPAIFLLNFNFVRLLFIYFLICYNLMSADCVLLVYILQLNLDGIVRLIS